MNFKLRDKRKSVFTLTQLLAKVSATLTNDPDLVRKASKGRAPAVPRGIMWHLAIYELGYTGFEVGKFLHLGQTGASLASRRGEKILMADLVLLKAIMDAIEK